MKMTVDEFNKKVAAGKERRENLEAEIRALLQLVADLETAAAAAAAAGDTATYKQKLQEKADAETDLFVKRTCLDNFKGSVTPDDAMSAWENYVLGYNTALKKALAGFAEKKAELVRVYSDLVGLQRAALVTRENLSAAVGLDANSMSMDFIPCKNGINPKGTLRLPEIGSRCIDPDAVYYLSDYVLKNNIDCAPALLGIPNSEIDRVVHTVAEHHS